jgi:tagatose 6-phosphate kinase
MAKILIAGLNPAWQQIFTLPALNTGEVNRAKDFVALASGKGMNAAKILAALGHDVTLWQVVAGENGRRMVDSCAERTIRSLHIEVEGETRVASTLLHAGETTEVIAPFTVKDETLAERLLAQIPHESYDAFLICGTVPKGLDQGVCAKAVLTVQAGLVLWDSVAGLTPEVLGRIDWLKVNAEEFRTLLPTLTSAAASASRPSLLITDGPRPATLQVAGAPPASCDVPHLDALVNPIGAGDTVTALLADGLLAGLTPRAAGARALAAAAASCLHVLPAVWSHDDAARIERGIRWLDSAVVAP